jgi:quercetin dioxygenase-like cupin family protein
MEVVSLSEADSPEVLDGVTLSQLAAGERMSVQHFRIEPHAVVDDHSHEHEQVGFLMEGAIDFVVDGEEHPVRPGDSFAIPSEAVHSATVPGDTAAVGVELFSPPRPDPPWAE